MIAVLNVFPDPTCGVSLFDHVTKEDEFTHFLLNRVGDALHRQQVERLNELLRLLFCEMGSYPPCSAVVSSEHAFVQECPGVHWAVPHLVDESHTVEGHPNTHIGRPRENLVPVLTVKMNDGL